MRHLLKWLTPAAAAIALCLVFHPTPTRADDAPAPATGSIAGTVVDSTGKGVADVKVRLVNPPAGGGQHNGQKPGAGGDAPPPAPQAGGNGGGGNGGGARGNRPAPIAEATTDKDGKFTMANIAPGDYMIVAGDRQLGQFGRSKVTVTAGNAVTVSVTLQAGGQGGGQHNGQKPGGGGANAPGAGGAGNGQ